MARAPAGTDRWGGAPAATGPAQLPERRPGAHLSRDEARTLAQREIAARYSLGYQSTDTRMDGAWRKVEIKVKRPDLKGAKLRTRTGYFAPYRPGSH